MPAKKKKKVTAIDKIIGITFTKLSVLLLLIISLSVIVNLVFFQFIASGKSTITNISDDQIKNWVNKNPKIIVESVHNMQKREQEAELVRREKIVKEKIPARMDELVNDKLDGKFGSTTPDVDVVEFFDYNCGYCKMVESSVSKLKSEKNIRIIYKEYPVLGRASEELAKVAIAVNIISPSRYSLFHHKLMKSKNKSKEEAIKIAGEIGINVANLKSALTKNAKLINDKIKKNRELALDFGINGTPAFIIGNQLIPGAIGYEAMKGAIDKARAEK